jgi:hypothetical protein
VTSSSTGASPTGTVAVTVLVVVLITATVPGRRSDAYARAPLGVITMPRFVGVPGIEATTAFMDVSMTKIVLLKNEPT